jgi:hypothetical protein
MVSKVSFMELEGSLPCSRQTLDPMLRQTTQFQAIKTHLLRPVLILTFHPTVLFNISKLYSIIYLKFNNG